MNNYAFPPLPENRLPAQTAAGADTWWQYGPNGEAGWGGRSPGGDYLQLAWDGLGLRRSVSGTAVGGADATVTGLFPYGCV